MMVSSGIKYTTWCLRRFYSLQNLILGRETFAIRFTNISNLCIDQKAPHTHDIILSEFQYKNSLLDKPSIISCKTTSKVSNLVNYSINIQVMFLMENEEKELGYVLYQQTINTIFLWVVLFEQRIISPYMAI